LRQRLVRALRHRAAHARAADVGEDCLAVAAVPAAVASAPEVDLAGPPLERDLDRAFELARDAVGADEVPAGAARDHRELDVEAGDPVDDLVHGSVPADRHEQVGVRRRLARELGQVTRALREQRVAAQTERRGSVRELGPAASCGAVLRGRIDQEDGSRHRLRCRPQAGRALLARPSEMTRRTDCC
jgi:hypothetical protein